MGMSVTTSAELSLNRDLPPASELIARDHGVDAQVSVGVAGAHRLDLVGILSAVRETAYVWDFASDRITWESNACDVLGVSDPRTIATGTDYLFLIAPEHIAQRQDAVSAASRADADADPRYRAQYRVTPAGRRSEASVWLEDWGRCSLDANGRAVEARGVIRVIDERYREEQRRHYRSDNDELTGQLNRTRLTEAIGAILTRAERNSQSCAFLIVAVDNLNVINETFGFDVGDNVLAVTARIIQDRLRTGDVIGRWSSNKFGVILNDCSPSAMRVAAERFMRAVRAETIRTDDGQISATLSIGGIMLPEQARTVQQVLSNALQALDKAKTRRQDGFMVYEPNAAGETTRRRNITLADEVLSALDQNRMVIALQPIVSTSSREPALYECLLRMQRPDGTIVSAGEFIEIAEQIGLSRLIDRRALELSIDVLKTYPAIRLSLNVSSLTASDHDWLVTLHKLTGGRRQLLERLTIEITETSVIHDFDVSTNFVDTLKELGCRVAIDDFGAGYTSFKNLKVLRVDMVKIDGSFVRNLAQEPSNRVFIKTLVEIAQTFGLETVAEWVADEETADLLADSGITYMQGFLFGRPFLASELPEGQSVDWSAVGNRDAD